MENVSKNFLNKHRKFRFDKKKLAIVFLVTSLLIAVSVFWWLKLVGITITSEAYCNVEEHTHTEACYQEENPCTKIEHTHTRDCVPNTAADVETVSDWLASIENVEITNSIPDNLTAIASSQVGYRESAANFQFDKEGVRHGYTRYGEWYGTPYGKWDATFVSFCLHYSNINNGESLTSASPESMRLAWKERSLYTTDIDYEAQRGDLVFFDDDKDGAADGVAIILSASGGKMVIVAGDSNDMVETGCLESSERILGFGLTGKLSYAKDMNYLEEQKEELTSIVRQPLMMFSVGKSSIEYYTDLTDLMTNITIRNEKGETLGEDAIILIGEKYDISIVFSETTSGNPWQQFSHDEKYLTYTLPENLKCEPFTEWHPITVTTEQGSVENVGQYYIGEDGVLLVEFYDIDDEHFVDKYSNVKFNVNFTASVVAGENTSDSSIKFNEKFEVNLGSDGDAIMSVEKTSGDYDGENHTIEYTVEVKATHGVVSNIQFRDEIWYDHDVIMDTVQVTDLNGVPLDPQPTVVRNTNGSMGFSLEGLPDLSAGNGYLITYKTQLQDHMIGRDEAAVWNGVEVKGTNPNDEPMLEWKEITTFVQPEKLHKSGQQMSLTDINGNPVPVIKWAVDVRKQNQNLKGTVIIDTLGEGLDYYTGEPIRIQRWDEYGNPLSDVYINWNDITIENGSISFTLPDGYQFEITYYTTHTPLQEGQEMPFTNQVGAMINGSWGTAGSTTNVIGIDTHVEKSAYGTDGQYVYFDIEANVQSILKNMDGHFFITDSMAFWREDQKHIYVENVPEDLVITAVNKNGETIATFTPHVPGGPEENTYILVSPSDDLYSDYKLYHTFNIYFNTANPDPATSKWILDEDAVLHISYKLPFSAKTFYDRLGVPGDEMTLGDALLDNNILSNQVYLNYMEGLSGEDGATYEYKPKIYKDGKVNDDGTIDYTVDFINTVPGSNGNSGYLNHLTTSAYFHDVFDEKLEYVPGSLTVTCSNPWFQDIWMNHYEYTGDIQGNEIHLHANQFTYVDTNPEYNGWVELTRLATLEDFYKYHGAGGKYTFTYKLKIKDEYLTTTDYSVLTFENTAEVTWDEEGTSDKAVENVKYHTGLLDKTMARVNSQLDFSIYVNQNALDIMEGNDTLTVVDTMNRNLALYWESIKLYYEDENGNWISFDNDTCPYTYTVNYNQITNTLTFIVPDGLHIKIDYTTLVTESGQVSTNNTVSIEGKSHVTDFTDAHFNIEEHSGEATGSLHSVTLIKHDGYTHAPLPNVTIHLYGLVGDQDIPAPKGVPRMIEMDDGTPLYYIGSYTTGEDGTVKIETKYLVVGGPYALLETDPPSGYVKPDKPVYFYYYEPDPNGIIQTVTTIVAVHNFTQNFVLPETGDIGTIPFGIIGIVLMAIPIMYSIIRRRRERRLT